MRVLMLGWEFPPFISGGLGTACYGLTKALGKQDVDVTFVLPKTIDNELPQTDAPNVKLIAPQSPEAAQGSRAPEAVASSVALSASPAPHQPTPDAEPPVVPAAVEDPFSHVDFKAVPSRLPSPYPQGDYSPNGEPRGISFIGHRPPPVARPTEPIDDEPSEESPVSPQEAAEAAPIYSGDIFAEVQRYADLCLDLCKGMDFDVIHAHDWPTFPAAIAVASVTGKPLIVHIHSTEFDRNGEFIHQAIYEIERRGMHRADKVIAVSHLTQNILVTRYDVPEDRIAIVYNGVENGKPHPDVDLDSAKVKKSDQIVLYLGRVTHQKGPEYFVHAAKKVLEKEDKVKFVMAGSGDKVKEVIELAAREGIGHKLLFTGFLHGPEVERIFKMADVYVMPSVSEPFGIATLEAISHDVPVIVSKQSGVSEVLQHVLKVDFWDTHEMANKILAVLKHPPLARTLSQHAEIEVRKLTWASAAEKAQAIYSQLAN